MAFETLIAVSQALDYGTLATFSYLRRSAARKGKAIAECRLLIVDIRITMLWTLGLLPGFQWVTS